MNNYIYAAKLDSGTWINKVGKYLNNKIDGAFKIKFGPMHCDIWMRMYYQIPHVADSLNEIHFLIDITSYQNKLRINITEDTKDEKTIGQIILTPNDLGDLETVRATVLNTIQKFIAKEYAEYDFIY